MSAISRLTSSVNHLHYPKERLSCNLSLYVVANKPSFQDENVFFSQIQKAVWGGASCVQLRDHQSDYSTNLRNSMRLKEMLKDTPLFINTRESTKIMQAVGAEGVYLEEGMTYSEARSIVGEKPIIGVPIRTMSDVFNLKQINAVDYISVKLFPSKKTCQKNDVLWNIEGLKEIRSLSPHRIVAIGGLDTECVEHVYRQLRSDDGVAMAGGLMDKADPCLTAQEIQALRERIQRPV